jgi:hypothetical protein
MLAITLFGTAGVASLTGSTAAMITAVVAVFVLWCRRCRDVAVVVDNGALIVVNRWKRTRVPLAKVLTCSSRGFLSGDAGPPIILLILRNSHRPVRVEATVTLSRSERRRACEWLAPYCDCADFREYLAFR